MNLVSPLNRVLGLGSAKGGFEHWWLQRMTAVALVPLGIWFAVSLLMLPDFTYTTVRGWIAQPWTGVLLVLTAISVIWHSHLGVQVVIEDYVRSKGIKVASLALSTFAHVAAGIAAVFAILRIAIGTQ